jgi:hypothetical protein
LPEGRIEFELTTASRRFEEYHFAFDNLLTSFRIESAGGR